MATTSKLSFRARNLDASKSMPVYVVDELPDLTECTPINRAVAQMPTGMEKDEEMVRVQHHPLAAILNFFLSLSALVYSLALSCALCNDH
ncbi:unnamed protein product [Anisakis simplex]|uniref:Enhancer of polycomb-like protein n=1 Tax=Anisakis simplex TaxID=6269 RepID=A0A0M3JZP6_ANISI|nr:unnamed protein product [Anisakis simplex]